MVLNHKQKSKEKKKLKTTRNSSGDETANRTRIR